MYLDCGLAPYGQYTAIYDIYLHTSQAYMYH